MRLLAEHRNPPTVIYACLWLIPWDASILRNRGHHALPLVSRIR